MTNIKSVLVIYENTDQQETTRLGMAWEWSTNVNVMRKGKLARARPEESLDEVEMFEGSENPLVMRQVYAHTFHCKFKLQRFPFDTQACSIDMVLSRDDQNMVELIPSILEMTEDTDLTHSHKKVGTWEPGSKSFFGPK